MSGPKRSSPPPPRYSVNVFDGKLNQIFKLQTQIQTLINELKKSVCNDAKRNIHFDCHQFLAANAEKIDKLIASFTIEHPGTFGQSVYDRFQQQINQQLSDLQKLHSNLLEEKHIFTSYYDDYQAYCRFETYFNHSHQSFAVFKSEIIQYLKDYIQEACPDIFKKAQIQLNEVRISMSMPEFKYEFKEKLDQYKNKMKEAVETSEVNISQIRSQTSDQVLSQVKIAPVPVFHINRSTLIKNKKIQTYLSQIETSIAEVPDSNRHDTYQTRLNELMKSNSQGKDEYFYIELLEHIRESEASHRFKIEISLNIDSLNQMEVMPELMNEKNEIIRVGLVLIEKSWIKSQLAEDFFTRIKMFQSQNVELQHQKKLAEQERLFFKQQLVRSLEALHYEVMDDLQVIDFERDTDFLLKIPNQKNYLNLRFAPDGSFLYNFLIPEEVEQLNIDQRRQKLQEMEATCQEFKKLLADLVSMGLTIELKNESPVSESVLIKVPKKHHNKIKEAGVQKAEVTRHLKKYLNQ